MRGGDSHGMDNNESEPPWNVDNSGCCRLEWTRGGPSRVDDVYAGDTADYHWHRTSLTPPTLNVAVTKVFPHSPLWYSVQP
jgi:hypothetical protein